MVPTIEVNLTLDQLERLTKALVAYESLVRMDAEAKAAHDELSGMLADASEELEIQSEGK